MNKFRSYKKQGSPLNYQSGGFNMDFFKNIAGNWKNFMKDPESAQSQGYLDDLVNRNKNVVTERKAVQDKLILPDSQFSEWGDQADQAYTEKIWEKSYAPKYGDWKSLTQDQQYDAWKKHKYSRPGWFNDTKLGDDLHQSGAMYDKDKATQVELGEVNKKVTGQLAETGAGIFSIMDAQKKYDNKPQEKFNLDFSNDKGIMRSQMGSYIPRAQQGYGTKEEFNENFNKGKAGDSILKLVKESYSNPGFALASTIGTPGIRQAGGGQGTFKSPVDIVSKLKQHPYGYTFPNDFDTMSADNQKALVDSYIADFNGKRNKKLDEEMKKTGYDPRQMKPVETIITPFTTTLNETDSINSVDEQDAWFAEQIRSGKEGTVQYYKGKPIKIQRSSGYKKRNDTVNSVNSSETGLAKDIYNKPRSFKFGGSIPTSPLGLYKYPGQAVNVPSGDITMQGIDHPVLAIPNGNKPEVMYPGKEYKFNNSSSVLEVPMMESGGYSSVSYNDVDDDDVKDQIKQHEGSVVDKYGKHIQYKDSQGFKTIGYGRLWKKGDPTVLTQRQADELFNKDYRIHKKYAESIPGYDKANSNQKKALINLTYNMGANWYKKFPKFTKAFEEGNTLEAAEQLRKSKWAKQVGKRSDEVIGTFLSNDNLQPTRGNIAQAYPTNRFEEDVPEVKTMETLPVTERAFDFLDGLKQQHKGFYEGLDFSSVYANSENV